MQSLPNTLQTNGITITMAALTKGSPNRMSTDMTAALQSASILKVEAPRYVKTKAQAIQLTVQKASPVPFCDSSDMFMNEQCPIMIAQVNRVIIPDNPISYPIKYVRYPFKRMRLVSLIGCLLIDWQFLNRQLNPKPLIVPKNTLKKSKQQKLKNIFSTTLNLHPIKITKIPVHFHLTLIFISSQKEQLLLHHSAYFRRKVLHSMQGIVKPQLQNEYFHQRQCCHRICCTQNTTQYQNFSESEYVEQNLIEKEDKTRKQQKAYGCPNNSQKSNHPKIIKKQCFSETVPRREDHRWQNNSKEEIPLKRYFFLQKLIKKSDYVLRNNSRQHSHQNSDCGLMNKGHFLILNDLGGEHVDHQNHHKNQSLDIECLSAHFKF